MHKTILLCTVGGSHEPILTSIRENQPDFVCFICSGKDPNTGKPGSDVQIKEEGSVIKRHRSDGTPTLPNIPTQAELDESDYEIITIPTDDPDEAFKSISQYVQELTQQHNAPYLIADYTGGTKSMSVALTLAAVENEAVELRLVTGARTNLEGVASGTERTDLVSVEAIRVKRDVNRFIGAWRYFAYNEAAKGFAGIKPRNRELAGKVRVLQKLSEAFDAWDRFNHQEAADIIEPYRRQVAPSHKHLLNSIKSLKEKSECQTPARLWDLWFNALRRAEQGRFDDAVARLYRLLEWMAQWLLQDRCKINTADVPIDRIPPDISVMPNKKGQYQVGLINAWKLVGHCLADSLAGQFSKDKLDDLQNQIKLRNNSILAHGDKPIGKQDWQRFETWIEDNFLGLLETEAEQAGLRSIPKQLPQQPWEEIEKL